LPSWVAPWQIPITAKECEKHQKLFIKKIKVEKEKGRKPGTNIKIENQFKIAEWILNRQKSYAEQLQESSSSSSNEIKKSSSRKNIKNSKKISKKDIKKDSRKPSNKDSRKGSRKESKIELSSD